MYDADTGFPFQLVRNRVEIYSTFVRERMEDVQRFGIMLLDTPDEIYPGRQMLADKITFQRLTMIISLGRRWV
jgi:hypothetical protein